MSYNTLRALLITSLIVNTLLIGYIIGGSDIQTATQVVTTNDAERLLSRHVHGGRKAITTDAHPKLQRK